MRASNNAVMGSSALTTEIHRREDGRYEATCPTCAAIPKQTGESVREVAELLRRAYQDWVVQGCPSV